MRLLRIVLIAEYTKGAEELLLIIANCNHKWQIGYRFENPKFVPVGTGIIAIGTYD